MNMKEINLGQATILTSPNPLTMICTENEDGTTNMAPVCFVSYLSFNPPMVGFAMGKASHSVENAKRTEKATIVFPGKGMEQEIVGCGTSTGKDTAKSEKFAIKLQEVAESNIQIPENARAAFVTDIKQIIETGDHFLHICEVKKFYGNESVDGVYAWNGFAKLAGAQEK